MKYEKTGNKVNKDTAKNATNSMLNGVGTGTIIWALVKRHRLFIITTYAIVLTVLYLFPFAPDLIISML